MQVKQSVIIAKLFLRCSTLNNIIDDVPQKVRASSENNKNNKIISDHVDQKNS